MTYRHLLRVRAPLTDVVRALDATSLGIQAATRHADLLEFQHGNGLIKADREQTVLQLLDDDGGLIVEEIMTCLHQHGYTVDHHPLGDISSPGDVDRQRAR